MSTVSAQAGTAVREQSDSHAWWESTQVWAGLAIVAMWLAVLCTAIFGPDIRTTSNNASVSTTSTTVPSVLGVALCALLATIVVARVSFARRAKP